jgi:hypothetical protein
MQVWKENRFVAIALYLWVGAISGLFLYHSRHLIGAAFELLGFR